MEPSDKAMLNALLDPPLHLRGHTDIFRGLENVGRETDSVSVWAAAEGNIDLLRLLVERQHTTKFSSEHLVESARRKRLVAVQYVLLNGSTFDYWETYLMTSADRISVIQFLANSGAISDWSEFLIDAVHHSHTQTAEIMIDNIVDRRSERYCYSIDEALRLKHGDVALRLKHKEVALILLERFTDDSA